MKTGIELIKKVKDISKSQSKRLDISKGRSKSSLSLDQQLAVLMGQSKDIAEHKTYLKLQMEKLEADAKEVNQQMEAIMRANKIGLPGKNNKAYEIGEHTIKIIEGENRYVIEKSVLGGLVPLFGDQDEPVDAARKFLREHTKVTKYSYVRISKVSEEKEEVEGEE